MSGCCIEVETPTSIKADDNIDVFEVAITTSYGAYRQSCIDAMWQRYRYRMIGSCNRAVWIQRLKDRADEINRKYMLYFEAAANMDTDYYISGGYEETRTRSGGKFSETVHDESERLPQDPTGTTKYLDRRGDTTRTYTPDNLDPETETVGRTDYDGPGWKMVQNLGEGFDDPIERFVREFDSLFMMFPSDCWC